MHIFFWKYDNRINISGLNIKELSVLFFDVIQLSPLQLNHNREEEGQQAKFCYTVNSLPTVCIYILLNVSSADR